MEQPQRWSRNLQEWREFCRHLGCRRLFDMDFDISFLLQQDSKSEQFYVKTRRLAYCIQVLIGLHIYMWQYFPIYCIFTMHEKNNYGYQSFIVLLYIKILFCGKQRKEISWHLNPLPLLQISRPPLWLFHRAPNPSRFTSNCCPKQRVTGKLQYFCIIQAYIS